MLINKIKSYLEDCGIFITQELFDTTTDMMYAGETRSFGYDDKRVYIQRSDIMPLIYHVNVETIQ